MQAGDRVAESSQSRSKLPGPSLSPVGDRTRELRSGRERQVVELRWAGSGIAHFGGNLRVLWRFGSARVWWGLILSGVFELS